MTSVSTYWAKIFIGLREACTNNVSTLDVLKNEIGKHVDANPICVTVTPTTFIYVNGREPGAIVGLINYPRFPSDEAQLEASAVDLAEHLKESFHQTRVSVMFPDKTIMIGDA